MRKALLSLCLLGLVLCGFVSLAQAEYPDKPLSMIVTYPPGGATDFQARVVTTLASDPKFFGEPVVIINKPGAGGRVGWNWFVDRAAKDGYWMSTYNAPQVATGSKLFTLNLLSL